jgi:hypothetical protein
VNIPRGAPPNPVFIDGSLGSEPKRGPARHRCGRLRSTASGSNGALGGTSALRPAPRIRAYLCRNRVGFRRLQCTKVHVRLRVLARVPAGGGELAAASGVTARPGPGLRCRSSRTGPPAQGHGLRSLSKASESSERARRPGGRNQLAQIRTTELSPSHFHTRPGQQNPYPPRAFAKSCPTGDRWRAAEGLLRDEH